MPQSIIPFLRIASVLSTFVLVMLFLAWRLQGSSRDAWLTQLSPLIAVLGGLVAAYVIRGLLSERVAAAGLSPAQPRRELRDSLARDVMRMGSVAILATAIILLVLVEHDNNNNKSLQTTGLSIFSAIVPVFSTWVGTVLAFYFSNESFKQAQASAMGAPSADNDPVTRPGTMIPFDRIIRRELSSQEVGDRDPLIAARDISLSYIAKLFQPPGVVRVVVFDAKAVPLYVLNHDAMPDNVNENDTLGRYLSEGTNAKEAQNFAWTARTATISDAKRLFELRRVGSLFITQNGRSDEKTIGWVPDDNIRKS